MDHHTKGNKHSMEINKLLSIFPNAELKDTPTSDENSLSFPIDSKWLTLPRKSLSSRERALLNLIIDETPLQNVNSANDHTWFRRLFLGEKCSQKQATESRVRIIQINLISHDSTMPVNNWLRAFRTMFKQPFVDTFLVNNHEAIVIEALKDKMYDNENFLGVSQALDSDFYCTSKLYIGQYWQNDDTIEQLFSHERKLFKFQLQQNTSERIFSISNSILKYYFEKQLSQDPLILKSHSELFNMPDAKKTVTILYQNGGNISITAKKMFLHRNTLQYRIKKFQETTGFNLRNMDDLLFCYLLTFQ
ncbi:hypothetical protein EGT51_04540 [Levilactobacillus suantsaiihabitans]|jgi:hypothetical protein|uniref:PucR C-terminal helix-turn-helix domain-containing protein n=2 Tax=Lactobacillaceae TaxID=33958 RepID=A0A4Z0JCV1_9LACO|nr:hypothetical protein EGT51_04540 [Levilactobacillus suantsaiihabitans]